MKKQLLLICTLLVAISFTACSSDDEPIQQLDESEWLSEKFDFNSYDGILIAKSKSAFNTAEDVERAMVGYAWSPVSSHHIKEDGTVEQTPYLAFGIAPVTYYFESKNQLYKLYFSDAARGKLVKGAHPWAFIDREKVIGIDPAVSAVAAPDIVHVLEKKGDKIVLTQLLGISNGKPTYLLSFYRKLSDKELKQLLSEAK